MFCIFWSESILGAFWTAKNAKFLHVDSEDWLISADAQANMSLPWAHVRITKKYLPALVAQLDATFDWRPGGRGFNPRRGQQLSFMENDHEIFSTVILSLPLIQEG